MFKNRIFVAMFLAILLTALLVGQIFAASRSVTAQAQAPEPIGFPDMTELSPNGQKVVYVTAQDLGMVGSAIWLANVDGSQSAVLVAGDAAGSAYWVTKPIWSPDSQQIAYIKVVKEGVTTDFVNYRYEIWAIHSNGSNNRLLTNTPLFNPSMGYGGNTYLVWNASNEIEFVDGATFPPKLYAYAINATPPTIQEIPGGVTGEGLPTQASIADVTAYDQHDSPWGDDTVNPSNGCNGTISTYGSAITAAAMVLDEALSGIDPGDVNTAMTGIGFDDVYKCYIRWEILEQKYSIQVDASFLWRQNQDVNQWRADILNSTKREISAGVPVILWYWQDFSTQDKNFLVVTGFNETELTANDPASGDSITHEFYDTYYPIEGMVIIKEGSYFSKIAPTDQAEDVNPAGLTLNWDTLIPSATYPDPGPTVSYRYCTKPPTTLCGNVANTSWTGAQGNTQKTLATLLENTAYIWQIQASIGTGPGNKITSNNGTAWTFTTGDLAITPTPTRTATITPTRTPTVAPTRTSTPGLYTISGNIGIGTPGSMVFYTVDGVGTGEAYVNASGNYSFVVSSHWSGTVTPYAQGYAFTPPSLSYDDVQENWPNQNYTPTPIYMIYGNVKVGGIKLDYMEGSTPKFVMSESNGDYAIAVPQGWSGQVTPSKINVTFNPPNKVYGTLTSDLVNQNYAATVTVTYLSTAAEDGYVTEGVSTVNGGANVFLVGDDAANRQYRGIVSFNTGGLPNNAVIQSAVLKIKQNGTPPNDNPFAAADWLWADVRNGPFNGDAALESADFNAAASAAAVSAFNETPVGGWYSNTLGTNGLSNINKTGVTQMRLRFGSGGSNNAQADYMAFLSGNFSSGQPQLIIVYTFP